MRRGFDRLGETGDDEVAGNRGAAAASVPTATAVDPSPRAQQVPRGVVGARGGATVDGGTHQTGGAQDVLGTDAEAGEVGTVFNVVNNIVGSGLLSLAWCYKQSGLFMGLIVMFGVCCLNVLTVMMLARCCEIAGAYTYKEVGKRALGPWAGVVAQTIVAGYTFGSCISYIVLIGDFIPSVLAAWFPGVGLFARLPVVLLVAFLALFPLSFIKDLNKLRFTSFAAFVCILYAACVVIFEYAFSGSAGNESVVAFDLSPGLWSAMPVTSVSYTMHYNAPRYYQELKNRSLGKMFRVTVLAFGICAVIYSSVALCGYLMFGAGTSGDILNNFPDEDQAALMARLGLAFVIIFTYPLAFHSLRTSVFALGPADWRKSTAHRYVFPCVTAVLVLSVLLAGLVSDHVETVLAYKGAVFGACLTMIMPGLMYASLRGQQLRQQFVRRQRAATDNNDAELGGADSGHTLKGSRDSAAIGEHKHDGDDDDVFLDHAGIELTNVSLNDESTAKPGARRSGDLSGISGGAGGVVVLPRTVAAASANSDAAVRATDPDAAAVVEIGTQTSTRYLWQSVLHFCVLHPNAEGVLCSAVVVWGCVSGLLGVLVTAGAIPSHK